MGKGRPTCAITTPISPAGTWTQGNFSTLYNGQNFHLNPGINNPAWYPASPLNAMGLSSPSFLAEKRFVTNPTSVGPILRVENRMISAPTQSANTVTTPMRSVDVKADILTSSETRNYKTTTPCLFGQDSSWFFVS